MQFVIAFQLLCLIPPFRSRVLLKQCKNSNLDPIVHIVNSDPSLLDAYQGAEVHGCIGNLHHTKRACNQRMIFFFSKPLSTKVEKCCLPVCLHANRLEFKGGGGGEKGWWFQAELSAAAVLARRGG